MMDKVLSNIVDIYKEILDSKFVLEQVQNLHLFNGAYCKPGKGPQEHGKLNPTDWTGKNAWDIGGAEGVSVLAIDGGTVTDVRDKPYVKGSDEFGRTVVVKTDNDTHYYSNLSMSGPKIKVGGKIVKGDLIGKIGKPKDDQNWQSHLHLALERGDLRSFVEDNCSLKKVTGGISLTGGTSGTTDVGTDNIYTKTGIGDIVAKGLNLESIIKKKLNEVTLMAPVPLKPNFKGNFGEKRSYGSHPGTDIGVPSGTSVKAPLSGKVVNVKPNQYPCGGTIDIDYGNGLWSRFCHIKQINVKEGDVVERGQVVGLSGGGADDYGRGRSSGPHLHFTLKKDGKNVDPADYMEKFSATELTFNKSDKESSSSSDDDSIYDTAKNAISNSNLSTQKDSEKIYDKTGIGDLFIKPIQSLGLGENELDEDKIYGDFGKDQKTRYGSITLPKDKNSKIKSPVSGKIVRGNYNPSCSNQICIEHDVEGENYILEYCNIKKPNVKVGQKVSSGSLLGETDTDVVISLFDNTGSRVYIDNYIKREVKKTQKLRDKGIEREPKLYDSPWGKVIGSILLSPFKMFQDKYDESGELKQKRWSSPTEKIQPDDWISQMSPTYPKKLKEQIERIKKIL